MANRGLPLVCALVDALVTLAAFVCAATAGKMPLDVIRTKPWALAAVVIVAVVAAWRGHADARRIISATGGWTRPAVEGFAVGFLPVPISHAIGMIQEALAAGPPWPSLGYSPFSDWLQYLFWLLIWAVIFGVAGGVYGIVLSCINRIVLRIAGNK